MSEPLVSVVLCTYNGARFIAQQLDSLSRQTYRRLEIVVMDDCSSDDTLAIVRRYAAGEHRIRICANRENVGFKHNFERAMHECRGDLIAPCDQDDVWLPEKISALVSSLGDAGLAYCDSILVDAQCEPVGPRMSTIVPMISTDDPVPFAFGNCVSGHAMLFRRELLQIALPIPGEFFHDWWIATVAAASGGIVFNSKSLVLYRQHGANVTEGRLGEMLEEAGLRDKPMSRRVPPSRGAALQYYREMERRLAAIAGLPGPHRSFAVQLHSEWSRREHQWFSPKLALMMLRHRRRLLRFTNFSDKKARRYCLDLVYGLRTKRLIDANAFT